ncbi:hypothetical protein LTR86_004967 [Recurvomyces mirabilis]|nr:hypothetical protein LTR86_004967 [Recurvomyces mirabilis]
MPNLKIFARRKSGNPLEDLSPDTQPSGTSSFRVLERPTRAAAHVYDGTPQKPVSSGKSFQSPLQQLRGKSADDLRTGLNRLVDGRQLLAANEALKRDRGSAGTTNSGSSGYYESSSASARHSSSSTLPSSVDQERERERDNEELYQRKPAFTQMKQLVSADADQPLPPPPSFKSRAGRAFSFGQKQNRNPAVPQDAPLPPQPYNVYEPSKGLPSGPASPSSLHRDRAMTSSSYASTAKPPPASQDQDFSLGSSNFGDDFGNMFAGIGKPAARSREELALPPAPGGFHRTASAAHALYHLGDHANIKQESEPMFPPRALSRQALTPSPGPRNARENGNTFYSQNDRNSQEGLMSSSALSSPRLIDEGPSPPARNSGIAPAFMGRGKPGYSLVTGRGSPALERTSSDSLTSYTSEPEKDKTRGYSKVQGPAYDDGPNRGVQLHDTLPNRPVPPVHKNPMQTASTLHATPQATAGASRLGAISPTSDGGSSLFAESSNATPKATKLVMHDLYEGGALFDSSPQGPPSRAIRPGHQRTESGTPRKMTKAQFEALQRSGPNSLEASEDEKHEEDDEDDEDESERTEQIRRQRKKQQANMAVYRQQMKKVTGGGPSDLAPVRPSMDRATNSAPPAAGGIFHLGGMGGTPPSASVRGKPSDDEDDEVPLGILQAHGFPGTGRPPTSMGENDPRRMSSAGSVVNGGAGQGNLPPFARRLPADPYFGSSLVNQSNRESLAFSSAQSNYGGTQQMQPGAGNVGGLVGVIASEERAKASRRGSPNPATGQYGMPVPGQMPQMPRTMSMGSMVNPQVYTPSGYAPGMPPMPMMPGMMPGMMQGQDPNQAAQMQNFMAMQMQLMQNVLAMQQQHMGQTPQGQAPAQDYLGVPLASERPMSMASHTPSYQPTSLANTGRANTMMGPPPSWNYQQNGLRPGSAMPASTYAPSGYNVGGPGPGYTPSIAPSERSNVGMPSRYRPVNTAVDPATGRSNSMTSSMTLQGFTNQQRRPESRQGQLKSTIRIIDKPKGSPKVNTQAVNGDEEEDDGWADMAKKRKEKKFSWRRKDNTASEPTVSDLYEGLN